MTRWQWLVRAMALSGAILLMSWLCGAIRAQSRPDCPRPCPNNCVPNKTWGKYPTKWRQWPGEVRLDTINPRALGSGVLQTPEGREEVPLPKAAQPQRRPLQQPPQQPPSPSEENEPLPKGGLILPPEGTLLPRDVPEEPGAKPKPPQAPLEGVLPGLPIEPQPTTPPKSPGVAPRPKNAPKPAVEKPKDDGTRSEGGLAPSGSFRPMVVVPALPESGQSVQRVWQNNRQPTAPAAPSLADRGARADAVVALGGVIEPERNALLPGAYRADPIAVAPNSSASAVEPAAYAMAESPAKPEVAAQAGVPPVALGGYCPVELGRNGRWTTGDLRWTVVYRGWIYRLSGPEQRQLFLANPDGFAPVNSGNDVVLSVDKHRNVAGQPAYCATYGNRLYMFSSQATQAEFNKNPQRYAAKR